MAKGNDWVAQRLAKLGKAGDARRADATPLDIGQVRHNGRVYDLYDEAQVIQLANDTENDPSDEAAQVYDKAMTFLGFVPSEDGGSYVQGDSGDYDVRPANRATVVGERSWLDRAKDFGTQVADDFSGATHAGMRALNNPDTFRNGGRSLRTVANSFAKNTGMYVDLAQGLAGEGASRLAYGGRGAKPSALEFDDGMEQRLGAMFPAPKDADPVLQQATDFGADPLAFIPQVRATGALLRDTATTAAKVGGTALKSPRRAAEMLGDKWIDAGRAHDATQGLVEQTLGLPEGSMPRTGTAGRSNILYPIFDSQSNSHAPWMTDLVEQARALRAAGKSPEAVFKKTRTVLGADAPDGITRVELDDKRMSIAKTFAKRMSPNQVRPLSQVINHPELSKADYHNAGVETNQEMRYMGSQSGQFDGTVGELANNPLQNYLYATTKLGDKAQRGTILHELQHKIDGDKGIEHSGSNNYFASEAAKKAKMRAAYSQHLENNGYKELEAEMVAIKGDPSLPEEAKREMIAPLLAQSEGILNDAQAAQQAVAMRGDSELSHMLYLANRGEANARLVSGRGDMTLKQRMNKYPYEPEYYKQMTGFYPDELWGSRASNEPAGVSYGMVSPEGEAMSPYALTNQFPDTFNKTPYSPNTGMTYNANAALHEGRYGGLPYILEKMMEESNWEKDIAPKVLASNPAYKFDKSQPKFLDKVDLAKLRKQYPRIMAENEGLSVRISRGRFEDKVKWDKQAKSYSTLRSGE